MLTNLSSIKMQKIVFFKWIAIEWNVFIAHEIELIELILSRERLEHR